MYTYIIALITILAGYLVLLTGIDSVHKNSIYSIILISIGSFIILIGCIPMFYDIYEYFHILYLNRNNQHIELNEETV
jgi:hypothetical protein